MMTNAILGPRPADPSKIRFDNDCFERVGERTYWVTSNPTGYGYPRRHDTKEAAEAYARVRRHSVSEHREAIMCRVKWF